MSSSLEMSAQERLIVALDVPSLRDAINLVDRLEGTCRWFKVGMELYYAAGGKIVEELVRRGYKVFLDLKLHDIPATAAGAVRSVADSGASLLTVHASGGGAMMEAAALAADRLNGPILLAVTVLTSMDEAELRKIGIPREPSEQVMQLAKLAASAGINNLVCSAEEVRPLRQELGSRPLLVVPGIRPLGSELADQRRVATPDVALAYGASMLVIGRPISRAPSPADAANDILAAMTAALAGMSSPIER